MPGIISQGKKKALSIAISYRDTAQYNGGLNDKCPPVLPATHYDPGKIQFVLREFGYKDEDMTFLIDDGKHTLPTKENILEAIDSLVRDARPGDHFVFHYSGHGGQLPNDDHNDYEEDGMDEIFYPLDIVYDYDNDKALDNFIVDDEIKRRLVDSLPTGTFLTAFIDCCHSGTSLDLPYSYSSASEPLRTMWSPTRSPVDDAPIPMIERLLEAREELSRGEQHIEEVLDKSEEIVESVIRHNQHKQIGEKHVTSWAACIDRDIEIESIKGGLLTSAIYKTLKMNTERTHRELIEEIAQELVNTNLKAKKYFERAGRIDEKPPFPKPVLSSLHEIEKLLDTPFTL